MRGVYITDPTQASCPRACIVAAIPQRELDHTYQGHICPERAIARAVGIDNLFVRCVKLTNLVTVQ